MNGYQQLTYQEQSVGDRSGRTTVKPAVPAEVVRLIHSLDPKPGMSFLLVGSAIGPIARLMSDQAGRSGYVMAVELGDDQIGPFRHANVNTADTLWDGIGRGRFDIAYVQVEPALTPILAPTLNNVAAGLKPGGRLAIETTGWAIVSTNETSAHQNSIAATIASVNHLGGVGNMDLWELLASAGLDPIQGAGREVRIRYDNADTGVECTAYLHKIRPALREAGVDEGWIDKTVAAAMDVANYTVIRSSTWRIAHKGG
jgi:protein-L-isoaspartate O-methyltransferase